MGSTKREGELTERHVVLAARRMEFAPPTSNPPQLKIRCQYAVFLRITTEIAWHTINNPTSGPLHPASCARLRAVRSTKRSD